MNIKDSLIRFWNLWPPFLFCGIRPKVLSKDFRNISVTLKLRFYNSNYVGTQYGGALFSMTDPFYMIMLIKNLGPAYTVWDKAASIQYLKPGRTDVTAEFHLSEEDLATIRATVQAEGKMEWRRNIEIKNKQGEIVATVEKVISIKLKKNSL